MSVSACCPKRPSCVLNLSMCLEHERTSVPDCGGQACLSAPKQPNESNLGGAHHSQDNCCHPAPHPPHLAVAIPAHDHHVQAQPLQALR